MTTQKNQKLALIYGCVTVLLWSTVATVFKIALTELTPLQLVTGACFVSMLVLFSRVWMSGQLSQVLKTLKQRPLFYLTLGALNPTAFYLSLFAGYEHLPGSIAVPVNYSWAVMLPLLAAPVLKQALSRWQLLGCLMGYGGVTIIATGGKLSGLGDINLVGIGLVLLAALIWCLYWIMNTGNKQDPVVSLLCCTLCGFPMLLILNMAFGSWPEVGIHGIAGMIYIGLFEMGVTYIFWLTALRIATEASRVSNLMFLVPVLSIMWISVFLGEKIDSSIWMGMALILSGVGIPQLIERYRLSAQAA
ncbi:DMT family transporter [Sansalvadorimonas verongulae]|uniref:DMT family transporter n=1 Tax=Sansalvadorimonas verongulae TaxID=2172824 RepID=UPI0012BB80B6|nr:DMT family transporter [Sansalvadorimonas verongulae]MTI13055.1 DMT family transporter [Sansalvadorimonas verongulae]